MIFTPILRWLLFKLQKKDIVSNHVAIFIVELYKIVVDKTFRNLGVFKN